MTPWSRSIEEGVRTSGDDGRLEEGNKTSRGFLRKESRDENTRTFEDGIMTSKTRTP